ncbi:MAG: sugar ABC transporter substrate-binding protein, partial [Anaerolineae bacterium]|nr:sugar ABC transporter substrate-binding protein [Anaerolineae bacterium]
MRKRSLVVALLMVFMLSAGLVVRAQGPLVIGVSNGFVGSEWRTQMIQNMEAVVAEFNAAGVAVELVV